MPASDPAIARSSWLAQASAEYERLSAALSALGSQLSALGARAQVSEVGNLIPDRSGEDLFAHAHDTAIRASLLGGFALQVGGQDLCANAPGKAQTVLKYLISNRKRPTPKDMLLDLLWPGDDPSIASSRLRGVMHTLRKCVTTEGLGFHDLVLFSGSNFHINTAASLWVDVEEFEARWRSGWRLGRAGYTSEAIYEYEQAEALYSGDFLEDDPYADWTLLRREALRDAYSTILTMLAQMAIASGDHTGAIMWAQKLLAQDNCREDAYRFLMMSHGQLGQHSRAAYWYHLCLRTLGRELAIEPSVATRELYEGMIR